MGGVLTRRQTGNSKKKASVYNQHYDPTKKSGKKSCYISKQNIALIGLNDERYSIEYKPLVKRYCEIHSDYYSHPDIAVVDLLERDACRLLYDMGWPGRVIKAVDKFRADAREAYVTEKLLELRDRLGDDISREQVFKMFFSRKTPIF